MLALFVENQCTRFYLEVSNILIFLLYHISISDPIIDFEPEANCLSGKGRGKKLVLVINVYLDFAFYTDFEWE